MRIVSWNDAQTDGRRTALLRNSGSSEFDPRKRSGAQATTFLRDLAKWERLLAESPGVCRLRATAAVISS